MSSSHIAGESVSERIRRLSFTATNANPISPFRKTSLLWVIILSLPFLPLMTRTIAQHFQGCGISVAPQPPPMNERNETSARSTSPENAMSSRKSGGDRVFECPVCMEEQSHLSSVPCGHLFCTRCVRNCFCIRPPL